MYQRIFKRLLDILISLTVICVFSPLYLLLMILGVIEMKGNPFFVQKRPGYHEKIFSLIKFRTMSNEKDSDGRLLKDEARMNGYGRFLRKTSLDELPEFFNILIGDMSLVGPRPWLVEYLPCYTEKEHHRHDVLPGLTGLAQVNGRNRIDFDSRIELDLEYVKKISFFLDAKIVFFTVQKVLSHEDIEVDTKSTEGNLARIRKLQSDKEMDS